MFIACFHYSQVATNALINIVVGTIGQMAMYNDQGITSSDKPTEKHQRFSAFQFIVLILPLQRYHFNSLSQLSSTALSAAAIF